MHRLQAYIGSTPEATEVFCVSYVKATETSIVVVSSVVVASNLVVVVAVVVVCRRRRRQNKTLHGSHSSVEGSYDSSGAGSRVDGNNNHDNRTR